MAELAVRNTNEEPDFSKQVNEIVSVFGEAVLLLITRLEMLELLEMANGDTERVMLEVDRILSKVIEQIDEKSGSIVEEVVIAALLSLVFIRTGETITQVTLNEFQQHLVSRSSTSLRNATRLITLGMRNNIQDVLEKATSLSLRAKFTENPLSFIEAQKLKNELKKELERAIGSGYVDKSGRVWKPETYSEVVANTTLMRTFNEANINDALSNGFKYGRIVGPRAKDECNKWRGRVIKLDARVPGNYPTYESLYMSKEVFHPHCRHWVVPIPDEEVGNVIDPSNFDNL
jgi:hypothetical protein